MVKVRISEFGRLAPLLGCILATACSSGGGRTTAAASIPAPVSTYCSDCVGPPSIGEAHTTGIAAGPIAAPSPGSFGTLPPQIATSGSPTFNNGTATIPANTTFPAIAAGFTGASSGLSAAADLNASISVLGTAGDTSTFRVSIPSLNVNATFSQSDYVGDPNGFIDVYNQSYVAMGTWAAKNAGGSLLSQTAFTVGYETPISSVPTSGNAQFSGTAIGTVFIANNASIVEATVFGKAALTVDFSSGQVAGALSQMHQSDGMRPAPGNLPWNDVSLNATIATGTNRFSGTTAATSAPGTAFSLTGSATGHLDGAFYGPAAQNAGAVWSLSDGNKSVLGTLTGQSGK